MRSVSVLRRSTRSEDDLTVKLMEIVRTNKNLERQEQNGAPQHVILEFTELLQYHIMTFMDNTVAACRYADEKR